MIKKTEQIRVYGVDDLNIVSTLKQWNSVNNISTVYHFYSYCIRMQVASQNKA